MTGVIVSVALACFISLQAAAAGASFRIVVPVGAAVAGVFAGFWTLAIGTLYQTPDLWDRLPGSILYNAVVAAVAGAFFTFAAARLIRQIGAFKSKYPDR